MKSKSPGHEPLAGGAHRGRRVGQVLADRLAPADHRHLQARLEQGVGDRDGLERAGVVEHDRGALQTGPAAEAEHVPRREHVGQVVPGHGRDRRRAAGSRRARGELPVATITSSGATSATTSGSTIELSRMVTPRRSTSLASHSVMAPMSERCGAVAAMATCPPRRRVASCRCTSWPRSAAVRAASRPAGPPPTTSTRLRTGAGPERVEAHRRLLGRGDVHHARERAGRHQLADAAEVRADARAGSGAPRRAGPC